MDDTSINLALRQHQEGDAELGHFFAALHKFIDRTNAKFFDGKLPPLAMRLEKIRGNRVGEYTPSDGYRLPHSVTVDPTKVDDGEEAAEVLAHEMAHAFEDVLGILTPNSHKRHSNEFLDAMAEMGIDTVPGTGRHIGYTDRTWVDWLKENADLNLDKFKLPGTDKAKRRMIKWMCTECGFSFHSRRKDVQVVCMNEECCETMCPDTEPPEED